MMEAVGEAQVFAEKTGLGTGPMEELIGEAFGPVAGGYSKRYVFGSFEDTNAFYTTTSLVEDIGLPFLQIDNWCICPTPRLPSWIRRLVSYQGCQARNGYGPGIRRQSSWPRAGSW